MSDPQNTQPPIYAAAAAAVQPTGAQMQQPETPAPVNAINDLEARVQAMVAAQVSAIEAKYADRVKALEDQLAAQGAAGPTHLVPEHAGGPGIWLAKTWSQWHQELARNGQLTPEILRAAGLAEEVITRVIPEVLAVA